MIPRAPRLLLVLAAMIASPALAVGLGPLNKAGITDGPDKAFWLTLFNSDQKVENFHVYALDADWHPIEGVTILPEVPRLGPGVQRKLLTVIHGLQPGETRVIRVCAEAEIQEGPIHARVCSKLSARRIAVAVSDAGSGATGAGE